VTVAKMASEGTGILLGPVNIGGQLYNVFFTNRQSHGASGSW